MSLNPHFVVSGIKFPDENRWIDRLLQRVEVIADRRIACKTNKLSYSLRLRDRRLMLIYVGESPNYTGPTIEFHAKNDLINITSPRYIDAMKGLQRELGGLSNTEQRRIAIRSTFDDAIIDRICNAIRLALDEAPL
jgi:hypothetical protein